MFTSQVSVSDKLVPELDKREKKRVKVEGRVQKKRRRDFPPLINDSTVKRAVIVGSL